MTSTNAGHWMGLDTDYQRPRYEAIRRLVLPHLTSGGTVLDVGCGPGLLGRHLPSDTKLLGIEPNRIAATVATLEGIPVFEGTAEEYLQVGSVQADAVIFNEMLYYSDRPLDLLTGFRKFLKPDGVMLVSIFLKPRRLSIRRLLEQISHPHRAYDNRHCAGKIDRFFRQNGWDIMHEERLSVWKLWLVRP